MFKSTESADQSWAEGGEFDDWGRFEAFSSPDNTSFRFQDEGMARRLASYIELPEDPGPEESRGWGWGSGRRKNNASTEMITSTHSAASPVEGGPRGTVAGGDVAGATGPVFYRPRREAAKMDVTAEKVAFRCKSPMGLLESLSGWAIIVKVKVA
ncbi:hypothetical protein PG994_001694 [Apiospora phragmitis]|uniref:Uncharacterized protein n=1 Tax=Apiospora phragmitis TaxID=2905665 RepID=A0ABR1WUB2_9PEZI